MAVGRCVVLDNLRASCLRVLSSVDADSSSELESVHAKYGSVVRVEDCVEEEHEDDQPASIDME